ncbi:MAG: hypothetical protein EP332_06275 [Bacteroidetes bacterium]|nr:MAG: hypothetical protein EP332_06275 [Bacteroidota bacterium]
MNKPELIPPVIRNRRGDLSKRWYVDYSFRNPNTDKMVRFREYGNVNLHADFEGRMAAIQILLQEINRRIFDKGFHPFAGQVFTDRKHFTIDRAIYEVIDEKQTYQKPTSFRDSRSRLTIFVKWLRIQGLNSKKPDKITKGNISDFLRHLSTARKISNRTRNNYLIELHSLFERLRAMELFPDTLPNPCHQLHRVPARSQRHISYTKTEMKRMQYWMEEHDPLLLLFTRHIIMGLRPIEIVRLKLLNYDLDSWCINLWAEDEKTGVFKKKHILESYRHQFEEMDLWKLPGNYYFFTSKGYPGPVPTTRDFFSKRFSKMKKELGLGPMHTMYGLRHTTIIELVKSGLNHVEIMKYSGHKTLDSFQSYIQQYLDTDDIPDISTKLDFVL